MDVDYVGFFTVMPFNTKIAFVSFLMAKFFFMPFSVLMALISPILGFGMVVFYGLTVFISIYFAIKQMMLEKRAEI